MSGKKPELQIGGWESAERAMAALAVAENELRLLNAQEAQAMAAVAARFEQRLQAARADSEALRKALKKFGSKHKRDFRAREEGGDTRSHEHAGVVMGYRTTPPQVRIEHEEKAVNWLAEFEGGIYVRTRAEPDRQALAEFLKDDSDPAVEKMAAHGITLQQKDKFFVEVKEPK